MYAFKTMVWRNYEVYSNNQNTVKGILRFYEAITMIYALSCLKKNKPINLELLEHRDSLISRWRTATGIDKIKAFIALQKQMAKDEMVINRFLDFIDKVAKYEPTMDLIDVDRRYVSGCFGTVIE